MIPATGPARERERAVDGSCTVPSTAPRTDYWRPHAADLELSPSGDERHRAVPCQRCGRQTWNWSALCNEHRRAK